MSKPAQGGVQTHDAAPLGGPIALAFLCVGANGLSTIAADTLFVSTFSLGELSRFYAVSAVVRVLAAFAFAALSDRLAPASAGARRAARFDAAILVATAGLLACSGLAAASGTPAVVYAVCVAQLLLPPLLPLVAFNATTNGIAARHAKRILPLVAAAATVGSIATSALATVATTRIGVTALFFVAAVACVAAAPFAHRMGIMGAGGARTAPTDEPTFAGTLAKAMQDVRRVPAVRVVVAFGLLTAMLTSFVDFGFKASLKQRYGPEEMAAVLGLFGVASNALILAMQLFVTTRFVGRAGIGGALASGPAIIGVAAAASPLASGVVGPGAVRLVETVFRYAVGNSVADVLLVPLARDVRTRAKVVVKGSATPIGGLAAGAILASFGESGPGRAAVVALVISTCAALMVSLRGATKAYGDALTSALARGRVGGDVAPEAAAVFRAEVRRLLEEHVKKGDWHGAERTLDLMTERFFAPADAASALRAADPGTRRAAVLAAARLTAPERGGDLLSLVAPDEDDAVERTILIAAREHGALADEPRRARAIERASGESASDAAIDLQAEALLHEALAAREAQRTADPTAQARLDAALKRLRKAARDGEGRRRAAALHAIAELGDKRAVREVQLAMGSKDPSVFAEAARAAVMLDAPGTVAGLVARLVAGPHAPIAARSLALAGPMAIRELVHALPVSRGEGAIAPTAVASDHTVSGTVRAARALARIGDRACLEVLPLFGGLGHRARVAVAHAFAGARLHVVGSERELAETALSGLIAYGESLARRDFDAGATSSGPSSRNSLLASEVGRRIEETRDACLDLMTVIADRAAVSRARVALARPGPDRDNALELLETLVATSVGARLGRLFTGEVRDAAVSSHRGAGEAQDRPSTNRLEGWLEKCRLFDEGALPSTDPMLGVLDKLLILRDVPLFQGLSGEELYPVAEIATVESAEPGVEIVKQGEASDDLYVVMEGKCRVVKDGVGVGAVTAGSAFGELSVLDGEPRAASVVAEETTRLLRIPRVELEGLLDESPELARGIIRTLLGYVRGAPRGKPAAKTAGKD